MFKKLLHPMQNDDPTLYEKSWGVFHLGRFSAKTILLLGTAIVYLLSYWFSNVIQALIVAVFSSQYGFFSGNGLAYTLHFLSITLLNPHAFFGCEDLLGLLSPFENLTWLPRPVHWLAFAFLWYTFVFMPFMYVWTKSRNLNHHEYGNSRIATPKEVRWQTFKVPDRYYNYGRHPGFPVMHTFNWRGKINKAVKTEKGKLQETLGIDDVVVGELYREFLIVCGIALVLILLWCGSSAFQYFTRPAGQVSLWNRFPHMIYVIIFWLIASAFRAVKMLFEMQSYALTQPFYIFGLFYGIEAVLIAMACMHIKDIFRAYNSGWLYALLHDNARQKLFDWREHVQREKIQQIRNERVDSQAVMSAHNDKVTTRTLKRKKHNVDHKSWLHNLVHNPNRTKGGQATSELSSYRNDTNPMVEAFDCFSHHPKLTIRFAFLEVADVLFPLDDGITGWYYLSPRPHNVWIYGTSGSGKGQMVVNPQMDINSRADPKNKWNMIVTDPKGESAAGAYKMLKKRGYDVKVMNIMDLSHSMSFNPLRLVIHYARLGDIGKAEGSCSQLSYTIYDPSGQGQNAYFYTSAASLFDSMAFALIALAHARFCGLNNMVTFNDGSHTYNVCEDGLGKGGKLTDSSNHHVKITGSGNHKKCHSEVNAFGKVTIRNISEMVAQLGGASGQEVGDQEPEKRLMIYFDHLSNELSTLRSEEHQSPTTFSDVKREQLDILDQAVQKYQQSKLAGSRTAGSIYSTFLDKLRIYMSEDVAQMTSKDNFNPAEMGFDRLLTVQFNRAFSLQNIVTKSWSADSVHVKSTKDRYGNTINHYDFDGAPIEVNKSHLSGIGMADVPFENPIHGKIFYVTIDINDERVNRTFKFVLRCDKKYYNVKSYNRIHNDYRKAPMVADMKIAHAAKVVDNGHTYPMFNTKTNKIITPCMKDKKYRYISNIGAKRIHQIKAEVTAKVKNDNKNKQPSKDLQKLEKYDIDLAVDKKEKACLKDLRKAYDEDPKNSEKVIIDRYTNKRVLRKVTINMVQSPSAQTYQSLPERAVRLRRLASNPKGAFIKQQANFLYNPRPTAWFIVAPQNKQELNQLGTFAIGQTFNVLSGISMDYTNGRHVQRPCQMILDELGNLPAIRHLDRMASFGRSQHIYIMPIFQAREQADKIYKQDVTNIVYDNCPTTVYILSNSSKTIQEISQGFGNRTVTNTSRSHDPSKIKSTNYNENEMKQPVMMPDTLRHLDIGEAAILRTTDRTNVWGKDTRPYPIFDSNGRDGDGHRNKRYGNHILPYSWWFLGKTLSKGSLSGVPIVTPHKYLNLETLTVQFSKIYFWMEEHNSLDTTFFDSLIHDLQPEIDKLPSGDYQDLYEVELNKASDVNKDGDTPKALHILAQLQDGVKYVRSISHLSNAVRAGQFILGVLEKYSDLNVLSNSNSTYDPKLKVNSILIGFNILHSMIDNGDSSILLEYLSHQRVDKPIATFAHQFNTLNNDANSYLNRARLINLSTDSDELTPKAKMLINNPDIIKNMLKPITIDFNPKVPFYKLINNALKGLIVPKGFEHYRGLFFLLKLFDKKMYQGFYTGSNNIEYDIGINIYANAMLSLIDAVITANVNGQKAVAKSLKGKTQKGQLLVSSYYGTFADSLYSFNNSLNFNQN